MKSNKFIKLFIYINLIIIFFCGAALLQAQEEDLFFKTYAPDALVVLDLSGSMAWNPAGGSNMYGNSSCSGTTFYSNTNTPGYTTDCRRVEVAKRVIFSMLDDTGNNIINSEDAENLGVRMGYMRFRNCATTSEESDRGFYSATSACEPDHFNCPAANPNCERTDGFCANEVSGSYFAATSDCQVPDMLNCRGLSCGRTDGFCNASLLAGQPYYASSACGTPDTANCTGADCYGGFCDSSKSGTPYYAAQNCSTPNQGYGNCTGANCSGGFCSVSKPVVTYYAHDSSCTPNTTHCRENWSGCTGGFCSSPRSQGWRTCTTACTSLGCTVGCTMPGCNLACSTAGCAQSCTYSCANECTGGGADNWASGCNQLIWPLESRYSCIYNRHLTSSPSTATACETGANACTGNANCVAGETATGGTHLAVALREAKSYLDHHKANDVDRDCRNKFVILISDGADTYACSGTGAETQSTQYQRRRESVARARQLAAAGYKVFVIGFGSNMSARDRNTLNWMAYHGGTDNPNETNSGSVTGSSAYVIPGGALYPEGITSCMTSTRKAINEGGTNYYYARANDPGAHAGITDAEISTYPLTGYAFFAADTESLAQALKSALVIIRESTQSFSQASVQVSRTEDENYLYEASFIPVSEDSFWRGYLKKFSICTHTDVTNGVAGCVRAGDIKEDYDLEAGAILKARSAATRAIKTYVNGSLVDFTNAISPVYFGYDSGMTSARDDVVGYIRGEAIYNPDQDGSSNVYKLGDVFRSNPITVGTPSLFFNDTRDLYDPAQSCSPSAPKLTTAFAQFRLDHCRAFSCENADDKTKRLIIAGANDGQLHVFKTTDMTEAWSFIPPNMLDKLKMITHKTHPTTLAHQYFVDGQISVTDAWLPSTAGSGTCKSKNDWKTLLIFGEGRGTSPNTWSSSPYCDIDFSDNSRYNATFNPYYCGYHALDITDTLNSVYRWSIKGSGGGVISTSHGPYFGEAWSKMKTGRVKINVSGTVQEKWVGFIGAGYNEASCTGTTCGDCDCRGKGFFVIDLTDGRILWSFTLGSAATATTNPNMKYSVPATPAVVDFDNDGFIDTAYIGDLGGNIWRFKLCKQDDESTCGISNWSGARIFNGTSSISPVRPLYVTPSVASDHLGNIWLFWGTGDKNDSMNIPPEASSYSEKFFALKDGTLSQITPTAYTISNLTDVTDSGVYCNEIGTGCETVSTSSGWYINLDASGEKVMADSLVFGGVVYFTSYMPEAQEGGACLATGASYLYALKYTSGAGALDEGERKMLVGSGIASSPVISSPPGGGAADMYVTVSSGFAGSTGTTGRVDIDPKTLRSPTNVLFWKDRRVD